MPQLSILARTIAVLATVALLDPGRRALDAQESSPTERWTGQAQANGSVFFGNSEQRVLGGHVALSRADSALELSVDLQTMYGDASIDGGPRTVTKRLLLATASLDLRPFAWLSPFVFGTAESNFEKRIASRYSAGAGAKQTFVRTDRTEASVSLALMDEHTVPRPGVAGLRNQRLTRWSWRGRIRHTFDDRLRLSHVTFWRPSVKTAARYVVLSTTELEYRLTRILALTLSFIDSYDSEAVRRGARTYNDGQILVGVLAGW